MKLEDRRLEAMRAHPDAEYNEHELYHLAKQVRAGRAATNALKRATDKFDAAERERLRSPGVKKAPNMSGAHKRRVAEIYRCRKDFNPNSEAAARDEPPGRACPRPEKGSARAPPEPEPGARFTASPPPTTPPPRAFAAAIAAATAAAGSAAAGTTSCDVFCFLFARGAAFPSARRAKGIF